MANCNQLTPLPFKGLNPSIWSLEDGSAAAEANVCMTEFVGDAVRHTGRWRRQNSDSGVSVYISCRPLHMHSNKHRRLNSSSMLRPRSRFVFPTAPLSSL